MIAVSAHLPWILLLVLPEFLQLAPNFTAENRQSPCQQGAEAFVEGAAENLQIMEIDDVILPEPAGFQRSKPSVVARTTRLGMVLAKATPGWG